MSMNYASEFTGPDLWEDNLPYETPAIGDGSLALRAGPIVATATSAWKSEKRKKAAAKGQALKDGSYPIADKEDWYKARQAIGRAGPGKRAAVIRHLKKRAKALGIPKSEYAHLKTRT